MLEFDNAVRFRRLGSMQAKKDFDSDTHVLKETLACLWLCEDDWARGYVTRARDLLKGKK